MITEFPLGTMQDIRLAHDEEYISLVQALHQQTTTNKTAVAFTPRVQRALNGDGAQVKDDAHCDTYFSEGSLQASMRAVGAVTFAVDQVLSGKCANGAFLGCLLFRSSN